MYKSEKVQEGSCLDVETWLKDLQASGPFFRSSSVAQHGRTQGSAPTDLFDP